MKFSKIFGRFQAIKAPRNEINVSPVDGSPLCWLGRVPLSVWTMNFAHFFVPLSRPGALCSQLTWPRRRRYWSETAAPRTSAQTYRHTHIFAFRLLNFAFRKTRPGRERERIPAGYFNGNLRATGSRDIHWPATGCWAAHFVLFFFIYFGWRKSWKDTHIWRARPARCSRPVLPCWWPDRCKGRPSGDRCAAEPNSGCSLWYRHCCSGAVFCPVHFICVRHTKGKMLSCRRIMTASVGCFIQMLKLRCASTWLWWSKGVPGWSIPCTRRLLLWSAAPVICCPSPSAQPARLWCRWARKKQQK